MHPDVPMGDDASLLEVPASIAVLLEPSSLHPAAHSSSKKLGCYFFPAEIGIFLRTASKAEL